MSNFVHKESRGTLYETLRKTSERSPDLYGTATLPDGKQIKLAGWWDPNYSSKVNLRIEYQEKTNDQ